MILLATLLLVTRTEATPSVWACPFAPVGCPRYSFLHYYVCCDDNPYQCCFHFETWPSLLLGSALPPPFFSGLHMSLILSLSIFVLVVVVFAPYHGHHAFCDRYSQ
uniref:Uncharacterized protein n=1 Tax=Angiostrongylus cantonensis TaxID=6313 RepID=A0A158PBY6_ANGCA